MERMRAGKDYEGMGEGKERGGPPVQTPFRPLLHVQNIEMFVHMFGRFPCIFGTCVVSAWRSRNCCSLYQLSHKVGTWPLRQHSLS